MPTFSYTAIEAATGRERRGTENGMSAAHVASALKARGLAPTSLAPVAAMGGAARGEKRTAVKPVMARASGAKRGAKRMVAFGRAASVKEIALFTRQLSTL
ncbi:MAG TPA: type II secretion system F family protein, partial [Opitutus sp.]|nr:type II secretion system F family protein [Opitutus sp.]